jgi:hypothetical protein
MSPKHDAERMPALVGGAVTGWFETPRDVCDCDDGGSLTQEFPAAEDRLHVRWGYSASLFVDTLMGSMTGSHSASSDTMWHLA